MPHRTAHAAAIAVASATLLIAGCSSHPESGTPTTAPKPAVAAPAQPPAPTKPQGQGPSQDWSKQDVDFLVQLRLAGFDPPSPGDAIAAGHGICDSLTQGGTPESAAADAVDKYHFTHDQANTVETAAAKTLCPTGT